MNPERPHRLAGSLLVLASALGFAFMPYFTSLSPGLPLVTLLFSRFCAAALVMWPVVILAKRPVPRGASLGVLVAMGAVLYVGEAMSYFAALQYIPSGLVSVLLYLYPALVAGILRLGARRKIRAGQWFAIGLATLGAGLAVGPGALSGASGDPMRWGVGIGLGLLCACVYAGYTVSASVIADRVDAFSAATIVISGAAISLGSIALIQGAPLVPAAGQWTGVLLLAVVSTVGAITALLIGIRLIGGVEASTLSTVEPLVTILIGAVLLGEPLGPWHIVGGLLITAGAILIMRPSRPREPAITPDGPSATH